MTRTRRAALGGVVTRTRRAALGAVALLGATAAGALAWPLDDDLLAERHAVVVEDRYGRELAVRDANVGQGHDWGELLPAATIAAEDHRFRHHPGVDPVGLARAAWVDLRARRFAEGGSTLTQQLARNLVPRGPGLRGKLGEAGLALRLEAHLSKDEILDQYLDRVFYGNGAIGADAAARLYFDRPPAALSLAQAATLAAIPQRPASFDPIDRPLTVRAARDRVLDHMEAYGFATAEAAAQARAEPLQLTIRSAETRAPHFVRRVLTDDPVVRTTLDLGLQGEAEDAVRDTLAALSGHAVSQAAVLVVENRTRAIRAYVGSAGWSSPDGQVDGVRAPRSPGSALKPFVYGLALEEGMTLADVVADLPEAWSTTHGTWTPTDFDHRSSGPVTLRSALANSLNVPAVRVAEKVGTADIVRRLQDLGVTTLTDRPDHYGLGLALGDGEVRLDELVAAYATLASGGRYRPLRFRESDPRPPPKQVVDPKAAWLILDALDDPDARSEAFGHDAVTEPDYPMAAKTGTSTGYRDNWAVGVTPAYTVGVWVGNFDGQAMLAVSGITGAAPLLRRVMDAAMRDAPHDAFERPAGLEARAICPLSGLLRGESCPDQRSEWFPTGTSRPTCDWHGPDGVTYPAEYAAWSGATRTRGGTLAVAYPPDGAHYWLDPDRPADAQAIPLRARAGTGTQGRWLVDGQAVATVHGASSARWVPTEGSHEVVFELDGVRTSPVAVTVATAR